LDLIYWGFLPYSSYGISGIFEDNPSLQIPPGADNKNVSEESSTNYKA
jgi:hypothetical protein